MTHVTIDAGLTFAVTVQTPTHRHVDFAFHSGRCRHVAVTRLAIHSGLDMRLVGEENVGFAVKVIDPHPRRLFFTFVEIGELLNLRAFGLYSNVATHTG